MPDGKIIFKQDDSFHWYAVPVDLVGEFEKLCWSGDSDDQDRFMKIFTEYMCQSPGNYTVVIVR